MIENVLLRTSNFYGMQIVLLQSGGSGWESSVHIHLATTVLAYGCTGAVTRQGNWKFLSSLWNFCIIWVISIIISLLQKLYPGFVLNWSLDQLVVTFLESLYHLLRRWRDIIIPLSLMTSNQYYSDQLITEPREPIILYFQKTLPLFLVL